MCVLLFCNNLLTVYWLSFGSSYLRIQARDWIFVQMFRGWVLGPDRQAGLPPAVLLLPSCTPPHPGPPPQAWRPGHHYCFCYYWHCHRRQSWPRTLSRLPSQRQQTWDRAQHGAPSPASFLLTHSAPLSHQTSSTEHMFRDAMMKNSQQWRQGIQPATEPLLRWVLCACTGHARCLRGRVRYVMWIPGWTSASLRMRNRVVQWYPHISLLGFFSVNEPRSQCLRGKGGGERDGSVPGPSSSPGKGRLQAEA